MCLAFSLCVGVLVSFLSLRCLSSLSVSVFFCLPLILSFFLYDFMLQLLHYPSVWGRVNTNNTATHAPMEERQSNGQNSAGRFNSLTKPQQLFLWVELKVDRQNSTFVTRSRDNVVFIAPDDASASLFTLLVRHHLNFNTSLSLS